MGHVDHGKTTLLDQLRKSQIVNQEFGGITQHIGAFVVPFKQNNKNEIITFLDTPGHAAFANMRKRGANVTDIVVLVIACEDGVLDQTKESIQHAIDSDVPIIVALNKIDKFPRKEDLEASIKRIRSELFINDIITEEDGGDVQLVPISALQGIGIDNLKDSILALSETLELKADPNGPVKGRVIESGLDPYRGKICTILVQDGTVKKGTIIVSSNKNWARVRSLFDENDKLQQSCSPGMPIRITGWRDKELPSPGDLIISVESEDKARKIVAEYNRKLDEEKAIRDSQEAAIRHEAHDIIYKELLKNKLASGYKYRSVFKGRGITKTKDYEDDSNLKKLNLVLKCDVDGSLEALLGIIDTYDPSNDRLVKLDLMHYAVGDITESDVILASSFPNSLIYGFNVKPSNQNVIPKAKQTGLKINFFNVVYHLIDDLKFRIEDKTPELEREEILGQAQVLQEFVVTTEKKKKSLVAGCKINQGTLDKSNLYKVIRRDNVLASDLVIKTLKHFKDEVKELGKGKECGIAFENLPEDINFMPGDIICGYVKEKYKPKLKWDIRGFE